MEFLDSQKEPTNEIDRFWLRKTHQPVLAVLYVQKPGENPVMHRGINLEVSMPTGSLCAERNAISSAFAKDPMLRREHIKMVSVLFVPSPYSRNLYGNTPRAMSLASIPTFSRHHRSLSATSDISNPNTPKNDPVPVPELNATAVERIEPLSLTPMLSPMSASSSANITPLKDEPTKSTIISKSPPLAPLKFPDMPITPPKDSEPEEGKMADEKTTETVVLQSPDLAPLKIPILKPCVRQTSNATNISEMTDQSLSFDQPVHLRAPDHKPKPEHKRYGSLMSPARNNTEISLPSPAKIPRVPHVNLPSTPKSGIKWPSAEVLLGLGLGTSVYLLLKKRRDDAILAIGATLGAYFISKNYSKQQQLNTPYYPMTPQALSSKNATPLNLFRSPSNISRKRRRRRRDPNPRGPCGTCMEWLKKIAETNPSFKVITFKSFKCNKVYCTSLI